MGVAFYIAPLINALIRMGTETEKERLFLAFTHPNMIVPSTKRGEKGLTETVCTQTIRNCSNAKSRQTREKERATELLDMQIIEKDMLDNKIFVLNVDDLNISNTLTGLCAMGVAAKYKKPVLLGRITPDGKYFKGSIRNKDGSPLKSFRKFLLSSGLMEFVEGHDNAAGYSIPVNNIKKLQEYAEKELINVDFGEGSYDVDFIFKDKDNIAEAVLDLTKGERLWGQGCPEPLIAVENMIVDFNSITLMGANKDTVKIINNGVSYLKFKDKDFVEKINEIQKSEKKMIISLVGTCNLNTWGGKKEPQIFITDMEIKTIDFSDF